MQKIRCPWAGDDQVYQTYHDHEWGVPVHDDKKLFEMLILEGFQAGLSWITILKRREHFKVAFADWDWKKIARFDAEKVQQLLANQGIIRNRLKINATITNAKAFMKVIDEFGSFDTYIWKFTNSKILCPKIRPTQLKDIPVTTAESDIMSQELKRRGFSFVGSTICYSFMQAVGMVDDHLADCFKSK